tara:strand:+ start:667 stop:972 length:306 start_codon:yes stop_codon:yes gene_type:complete
MKKKDKNFLEDLYLTIKKRSKGTDKNSYTKLLLSKGKHKIAQKVKEESSELILDYLKGTKKRTVEEASDLIYHVMVLLYSKKITLKDIEEELSRRKGVRRK